MDVQPGRVVYASYRLREGMLIEPPRRILVVVEDVCDYREKQPFTSSSGTRG